MSTERDTHFAGFAEGVASKLKEQGFLHLGDHIRPLSDPPADLGYEQIKRILAQSAYDLAVYVIHMTKAIEKRGMALTPAEIIEKMPELKDI